MRRRYRQIYARMLHEKHNDEDVFGPYGPKTIWITEFHFFYLSSSYIDVAAGKVSYFRAVHSHYAFGRRN